MWAWVLTYARLMSFKITECATFLVFILLLLLSASNILFIISSRHLVVTYQGSNDTFFFQLVLATIPDANGISPSIVTDNNIKLLFEIQKKVNLMVCVILSSVIPNASVS